MAVNNTAKRCVEIALVAYKRKKPEELQAYSDSLGRNIAEQEEESKSRTNTERACEFASNFMFYVIKALCDRAVRARSEMGEGTLDMWNQWQALFKGLLPVCDISRYGEAWFTEAVLLLGRLGWQATVKSGVIADPGIGNCPVSYLCIPDPEAESE